MVKPASGRREVTWAEHRFLGDFAAPEPEEWHPTHSALPSNVDDPERAREHYSTLAEQLVALLHTRVPSVFEETPESLSDVDYQFWHEDFHRVFEQQEIDARAVPSIGAYLGQVLVRHLGGPGTALHTFAPGAPRLFPHPTLPRG
jgi:hypothetical protein